MRITFKDGAIVNTAMIWHEAGDWFYINNQLKHVEFEITSVDKIERSTY